MEYLLGELFELQMGKTPDRNNDLYWQEGLNEWISIADLGRCQKYICDTKEKITDKAVKESGIKIIPKNTVIMSFKLSLGKLAITSKPIYSNEAIMAFLDKHVVSISSDYLYYLLMHIKWEDNSNKAVMGKTLNKAVISRVKVKIHGKSEQENIVKILDKTCYIIRQRKKQLQEIDNLVKSRFVELFGDPVSNPFEWDKVPLSELADIKIGPFGSLLHKDDYIENGHPLVNPSHIKDGKIVTDSKLTISDEKYGEMTAYHLKIGDVVMGRRGEMGRCAVVSEDGLLCGTGSLLIRSKGEITADYIQKIISFPSFKKIIEDMAVGQTMPNLNVPIVSNFKIIKPPIGVQHKYYSFVHEIDKLKVTIQKSLEQTQLLFDNLMQEYFG